VDDFRMGLLLSKNAIYIPNFGDGVDPRTMVDLAKEAEAWG
jgi:hypothetical protein